MIGGITVVGCVTGTHVIEDIKIVVPHKIAVHIPAELVLRSKDLHRSLQGHRIMKLDGGSGLRSEAPAGSAATAARHQADAAQVATLLAENKKLRQELREVQAQSDGLRQVLASLGGQLSGIQGALGRLETQGAQAPAPVHIITTAGQAPVVSQLEAVGGEAPTFIPGQIAPSGVEASIQVRTETAKDSNLSDARSKLREMRQKAGES